MVRSHWQLSSQEVTLKVNRRLKSGIRVNQILTHAFEAVTSANPFTVPTGKPTKKTSRIPHKFWICISTPFSEGWLKSTRLFQRSFLWPIVFHSRGPRHDPPASPPSSETEMGSRPCGWFIDKKPIFGATVSAVTFDHIIGIILWIPVLRVVGWITKFSGHRWVTFSL